jgi:hypothetical protein
VEGPWPMTQPRQRVIVRRQIRRGDKPSAWTDPRFWATILGSILGLVLTAAIFLANLLLRQMDTIHTDIKHISDTQIQVTASQGGAIDSLKDYKVETSANFREQTAYNLGMSGAMREITTTLKLNHLPVPDVPEPPKFGGH